MFKNYKKTIKWGGKDLVLETGKIARQADGAVMVTYGETMVLCTVVGQKESASQNDFFPLTVHYIEKFYSVGKIKKSIEHKDDFFEDYKIEYKINTDTIVLPSSSVIGENFSFFLILSINKPFIFNTAIAFILGWSIYFSLLEIKYSTAPFTNS